MRTLVVSEFITLDGVVEAPGGEPTHPHSGWTMAHGDPELYAYKLQETLEAESLLLGRVTYEGFSAAWPERGGVFADKMNAMPKHVVTSTLHELGWNATARRARTGPVRAGPRRSSAPRRATPARPGGRRAGVVRRPGRAAGRTGGRVGIRPRWWPCR
jgi:hypothetical protein